MEQANNTFSKGLQLDTHPMIQGNETLTDCLNGTLITMNGNEVILQNDMGNRRIDNAFLPSGYEPVGIKEYGGIIYIAAYNPITNKSQIGSFPSPQKKISELDNQDSPKSFNFEQFFSVDNKERDNNLQIDVIKTDSFMIPLTKDNVLRAGDKFVVYSSGLSLNNNITNYKNTEGDKARSPKNKKYTLQIGVLNSQNEFVDITKTLCRWSKDVTGRWYPKNYDSDVSEIFKFNDEYFIPDEYPNLDFFDTISDSNLIKSRQVLEANTYSYKLIGPLYLKISLNHIENFNYNIYGIKDDEATTIWVEGYLNYNCPDKAEIDKSNSNENYYTFEEGLPKFNAFDFIPIEYEYKEDSEGRTEQKTVYNPSTNLYSTKIVKKYKINGVKGQCNYIIGVQADNDNNNCYLRGLSTKGILDLSLIGSGIVKINGWRYYNNVSEKSTILTFSFNAYPEYGKRFGNLKFKFTDIKDNSNVVEIGGLPLYNGRQTITIDWNDNLFKERKVYKVETSYDIINDITGEVTEPGKLLEESFPRWFLSTELFNEFYQVSEGIEDFCNTEDTNKNEKFLNKLKINVSYITNVTNNSTLKLPSEYEGSLLSTTSDISYSCKHTYNIDVHSHSKIVIFNEELYPDYIKVKQEKEDSLIIDKLVLESIGSIDCNDCVLKSKDDGLNNDINTKFKKVLFIKKGTSTSDDTKNKLLDDPVVDFREIENGGKTISGTITFYDRYKAYNNNPVSDIENAFDDLSNIIEDASPKHTRVYSNILVNYDGRGSSDYHFIDFVYHNNKQNPLYLDLPQNSDLGENAVRIKELEKGDEMRDCNISSIISEINDAFNKSLQIKPGQMFCYAFYKDDYNSSVQDFNKSKSERHQRDGRCYTRVWWRTSDNGWAVFKDLFNIKNNTQTGKEDIESYINDELSHQYVYCMYNNYLVGDEDTLKLYMAEEDYAYYDLYSIPITIRIIYKITESVENIVQGIKFTKPEIDKSNLFFTQGSVKESDSPDRVTFTLNSSQEFQDSIIKFNKDSVSNVYLQNGVSKDSKGRDLNPNYIYYKYTKKDGKTELVRINNSYLQVDREHLLNGKNTLVYNRQVFTRLIPYTYQSAGGDSDEHTVLIYDSINTVDGV